MWSSHRNISPLKNFHSFKLICLNIVDLRFCLAYSFHHNFLNIMPRREQVRSIFQPFKPSSGADDGLEFIQCVGGLHPEIDEVWNFGDHRITPKVHPFTHVYVGNFIRECFGTDYLAGNGHRVSMFVQKLINVRVEWIGVPSFLWNDEPPWDNNMLCPHTTITLWKKQLTT